jgi:hypothetical protein
LRCAGKLPKVAVSNTGCAGMKLSAAAWRMTQERLENDVGSEAFLRGFESV